MKHCSRLLACTIPIIVVTGCNGPTTSRTADDTPSLAQQACLREDVQDVVSNEVKSIFQKGFYKQAGTAILLLDPREISAEFERARASFHDVTVADAASANTLPIDRVVCTGTLQIDESNSQQGQQIVQVPKLRWSIEFAQAVNDPQSSAFTVTLDQGSLADDLRFNGKPIAELRNRSEVPSPAQTASRSDADGTDNRADLSQDAGERAADAAGDAAARASAAAAEAEREINAELGK